MNPNSDRRACLEETDGRVHSLRRAIRIETEIIQRAPANRVGILVLRKSLRAPAQRAGGLILRPRSVAKSRASLGAVIGNSRMIRRSMKPNIADGDSASQRHTEGLDRAIKILIIDRVLIMPYASDRAGHFVANKPLAIDSRCGLKPANCRSRPGVDGWGRSHGVAHGLEGETRRAGDCEAAIGRIVVHVALPGVGLAPGVLMRSNVLRFRPIRRAGIQRCVEVAPFHQNTVRGTGMGMAGVAVCTRGKSAGKGIHPGA